MNFKTLLIGVAAATLAAGGAVYATGFTASETSAPHRAVSSDHIPGALPLANWTYGGGCKTENNNANVGYIKSGATASIDFTCDEAGAYEMSLATKVYDGGKMNITVTDLDTGAKEINQNWTVTDGDCTVPLQGLITEGKKNITFTISSEASGYLFNYYEPTFTKVGDTYDSDAIPEDWDVIPGEIPLTHWTYGTARLENNDTNVGWVTSGSYATSQFFATEKGVYGLDIDFYWFNAACDFTITITDDATARKEIEYTYTVDKEQHPEILLPGVITKGRKSVRFDVNSSNGGFLINWKVPTFNKIGESFAQLSNLTVADKTITSGEVEGYDYAFTIPMNYTGSAVTFTPEVEGATAVITASGDVTVTDNGDGTYSIPTPALNAETIVTISLDAEDGAYKGKEQYTARFFRLGGVMLSSLDIDSFSLDTNTIEALNNDEDVTVTDYIFTALPTVTATFADGSQAEASSKLEGTKATYTFTGNAGDIVKTFTFAVDGIHIYTRQTGDLDADLRYDSQYKQDNDVWSNGLYTLYPCGDGWGGTQFKLNKKSGNTFTLTCPSDMKIKQLVFAQLFDNYAEGKITSVTSEGATIWLPSASSFALKDRVYDLVMNVENHVAGTPIEFVIEGGSQPVMWFEFVYEIYVPSDAPKMLKSSTTDLTGKNHTVVSFNFNREIEAAEVEFNGSKAASHVIGTTLNFPLWDLDYDTEYTFTLPAGSVKDTYGNVTAEDYSITFTTGSENYVEAHDADRFIRVSNVDELRAAVDGLAATNGASDSPATIIFMANGDYDLGTDDATAHLDINKVYNVSLIGQSQEGVLIHGTRTGISNPVLSTRHSNNIYMENFTLRNDLDFGKPERVGVGVAHYGGNLDLMKNVTLQSIQDTQVTGERGYYYNVTIHGNVDYICGGGDHFYDNCTLVQEGEGGYITAPATSAANKHGYVFYNCTIKGDDNYYLGRPWQNEPRCYWINTTMLATPKSEGWGPMSNLPTHFYEYNSMDASGKTLDLSARKNSTSSTNTYTPVLTADEAAYFTHRNVLGYTDSWDPTELTAECEAPTVTYSETGLNWNAVKNAAGYLIYIDGTASHFTSETSFAFPTVPAAVVARAASTSEYKVAAISASGSHGTLSAAATPDGSTTGIDIITTTDADAEYFNLQGQPIANPSAGVYIMRTADSVKKVIIR